MATGVKPRDEDPSLTRTDLEAIQDAMKSKTFRDLLTEYCDEVRDPANQAIYQKEMTQLEKERGYDVTFINPKGSYVIKTSVAGDRKAFINICSNDNVVKPSCCAKELNGQKGMNWQLPYTIIPPREDFDSKKERCVIYDVVFHPDTLRMAEVNKRFRELVNKTAVEGLQKTYNIHFDDNNYRFPKSNYKGMTVPAVIRKEDPNFKPLVEDEVQEVSSELLEKLYPQNIYSNTNKSKHKTTKKEEHRKKAKSSKKQYTHTSDDMHTIPKYIIKQQQYVDLQDFTYAKHSKQYAAIPTYITVEINLPLLTSTKDCVLNVRGRTLDLISEKPAKYKLNLKLPYTVNEEGGNATYDISKHLLIVKLPVLKQTQSNDKTFSLKANKDSGVESEENSNSDEESKEIVTELVSNSETQIPLTREKNDISPVFDKDFLLSSIGYTLPAYTHNVLDEIIAFTFHVKNTDPESVLVKNVGNKIYIKFSSIGSGFVPVHYAALILFDDSVIFDNATGEAWDNNVILQLHVTGEISPEKFQIGLTSKNMKIEYFDVSQLKKKLANDSRDGIVCVLEEPSPSIEVTNVGRETNILVSSSNQDDSKENGDEFGKEIIWTESNPVEYGAKSILRKPVCMTRSFSESSVGDVASSFDYMSSDCIPEESSLKKTVRFSDVIAKQFYRYNSSIEGQKKKNQRKKSKKRNLERRKSESEAEEEVQVSKSRSNKTHKERRDSGVIDTSDAEDFKNTSDCEAQYDTDENANINNTSVVEESFNKVDNNGNSADTEPMIKLGRAKPKTNYTPEKYKIEHNSDFYDPDKLNKGQYLDIKFKNDLIFDLDM